MGKFIDRTGQVFGNLRVISFHGSIKNVTHWLCRCVCGKEKAIRTNSLVDGSTKSCGCLKPNPPGRKSNLIGFRSGALVVIESAGVKRIGEMHKEQLWKCICDCGSVAFVPTGKLTSNHTKSCGCLQYIGRPIHGQTGSREHNSWASMLQRCCNPKHNRYRIYGGRGIQVCERWRKFENFLEDMGPRPEGTSLDRINNDGNYEPSNCRWATDTDQSRNRSIVKSVCIDGVDRPIAEWAEIVGIDYGTIVSRIKRGMSPVLAITTPLLKQATNRKAFDDKNR